MDPYIWWLTQADCEAIGPSLPDAFPPSVRDLYRSRYGGAGRARLWAPLGSTAAVDPWPDTPLARLLVAESAGGLVVDPGVLPLLTTLPGTVTDLRLQRATP